jgi:porin
MLADLSQHNHEHLSTVADEPESATTQPNTSLKQINQYTQEPSNAMAQVTSVSQLSDVQPTDWAFQALQLLVERYGVISGYPDRTFRGNRAMTRYEFAAGLNAALDRINELIAAGTADRVRKEDLAALQRLQEEFASEVATLRGRTDTLEARTATQEVNQFSTTTKLTGQAIFAVNAGGFSGDRIIGPTGNPIANQQPNATFIYRAFLNFNTSFTGKDRLQVLLETGSDGANDNAAGFLEPTFGSVLDFSARHFPNDRIGVDRLNYNFTPFENFSVSVGPVIAAVDYVDRNQYADFVPFNFSTRALVNNAILLPINQLGSGAAINWNPGKGPFTVRAVYLAADGANPDPNNQRFVGGVSPLARLLYPRPSGSRGLFGDPYQGIVELGYSPNKALTLRLQYSGGKIFDGRFDAFGVNFDLALSQQFGIFGRYGYGSYNDTAFGDINPNYWMAGVSFPELFVSGALAGIAAGQPFIEKAVGNATQTNIEAFYSYPVSNNIRIKPVIQVITNPANQSSNGTIFTGTLETIFSF